MSLTRLTHRDVPLVGGGGGAGGLQGGDVRDNTLAHLPQLLALLFVLPLGCRRHHGTVRVVLPCLFLHTLRKGTVQ